MEEKITFTTEDVLKIQYFLRIAQNEIKRVAKETMNPYYEEYVKDAGKYFRNFRKIAQNNASLEMK